MMKRPQTRPNRRLLLALLAAAIIGAAAVRAQIGGGYDLTWNTIDGGGGASSGGGYQLDGTLGQSDAGPALSGGPYSLAGGFWSGALAGGKTYIPLLRR